MSAAKHTPGPWFAVGAWVEIESTTRPDICSCDPKTIGQTGRTYEQMCANARLISAAPDLLAVLQELQESAAYWSEYDVPLGIVSRINYAIAKATDAQP